VVIRKKTTGPQEIWKKKKKSARSVDKGRGVTTLSGTRLNNKKSKWETLGKERKRKKGAIKEKGRGIE